MSFLDTVKEVASLAQKVDNIPLMRQVMQLQVEAMALLEENLALKERLKIVGELSYRDSAYFRGDDGPFCSRCWDVTSRLVRLHVHPDFQPECPECTRVARPKGSRIGPVNF